MTCEYGPERKPPPKAIVRCKTVLCSCELGTYRNISGSDGSQTAVLRRLFHPIFVLFLGINQNLVLDNTGWTVGRGKFRIAFVHRYTGGRKHEEGFSFLNIGADNKHCCCSSVGLSHGAKPLLPSTLFRTKKLILDVDNAVLYKRAQPAFVVLLQPQAPGQPPNNLKQTSIITTTPRQLNFYQSTTQEYHVPHPNHPLPVWPHLRRPYTPLRSLPRTQSRSRAHALQLAPLPPQHPRAQLSMSQHAPHQQGRAHHVLTGLCEAPDGPAAEAGAGGAERGAAEA